MSEAADVRAMNAALDAAYAALSRRGSSPDLLEALVRARSFIAAKCPPAEQAREPLLAIIDDAIAKARQA